MKLSSKVRYAIRALFDIAFHGRGGPTQARQIAERQGIPPRFLEQIFQDLRKGGLVAARRGPKGGYQLTRDAAAIALGDVTRILEGPVSLSYAGDANEAADPLGVRVTTAALEELGAGIQRRLDEVTLADLCSRAERDSAAQRPPRSYVYVI